MFFSFRINYLAAVDYRFLQAGKGEHIIFIYTIRSDNITGGKIQNNDSGLNLLSHGKIYDIGGIMAVTAAGVEGYFNSVFRADLLRDKLGKILYQIVTDGLLR